MDAAVSQAPQAAATAWLAGVEPSRRWQSLWVSAARAVSGLLGIAVPLVVVRVLDQTTFGYYKELFLIGATASSLLGFGLAASLYHLVPRFPHAGQTLLVQSGVLLGVLGLAGGAGVLAAGPLLQHFFHAPLAGYLPWVALLVVLSLPASLLSVAPMVDRRSRLAALLLTGFDILRCGVLVLIALATRDLVSLLVATCAVMVLQCSALVAYLLWRRRTQLLHLDPALLRAQLRYALPFAAAAFVGLCRDKLHAYYVGGTVTSAEFAIYAVGLLQVPLIDYLSQTLGEVVVLENSAHFAAGNLAEMRRIWYRAAYGLALVALPLFAFAELFAGDIIVVLFGPQYAAAATVFRVYAMTIPLVLLFASPLLRATGDLRAMLWADIASLLVSVGALAALVGTFGPLGAVGSLVVGNVTFVLWASRLNAVRLELPLRSFLPWAPLARVLLLSAGAALAAFYSLSNAPAVVRLIVGGGLGLVLYALAVWRAGLIPAEERRLMRDAAHHLRRWFWREPTAQVPSA
jgi:O-antigen/teichoic acid export membrane protein